MEVDRVRQVAVKHALKNSIEHGGKALEGAVVSKVFAELPELKKYAKQVVEIVKEVVSFVNSLSTEERLRLAREKYPEILEEAKGKRQYEPKTLPPLPNSDKYKVIKTRFAPNPDFYIHLGNARPALLSYEYAREYRGRFVLRFEDTDPRTKRPMPEAYRAIKEDLKWLGIS